MQLLGLLALSLFTYYNQGWWLLIPVVIYISGFSIGMGGTIFFYIAEILPSIGLGICFFVQWICTSCIAYFMPGLIKDYGGEWIMIFFSCCCGGALVFIVIFAKETKG